VPEDDAVPPADYKQPSNVWAVEYMDERQPGWRFQAGAFTTEAEARKLLRQLEKTGAYGGLLINLIPVHETVQDWEWDR
jgi:hypothetical protein